MNPTRPSQPPPRKKSSRKSKNHWIPVACLLLFLLVLGGLFYWFGANEELADKKPAEAKPKDSIASKSKEPGEPANSDQLPEKPEPVRVAESTPQAEKQQPTSNDPAKPAAVKADTRTFDRAATIVRFEETGYSFRKAADYRKYPGDIIRDPLLGDRTVMKLTAFYDFDKIHKELKAELLRIAEVDEFKVEIPEEFVFSNWNWKHRLQTNNTPKKAARHVGEYLTLLDHFFKKAKPEDLPGLVAFSWVQVVNCKYNISLDLGIKLAEAYLLRYAFESPAAPWLSGNIEETMKTCRVLYKNSNQYDKYALICKYEILYHQKSQKADLARLNLYKIYDKQKNYQEAYYWLCQISKDGDFKNARSMNLRYKKRYKL